jgi:hypothetical protein
LAWLISGNFLLVLASTVIVVSRFHGTQTMFYCLRFWE